MSKLALHRSHDFKTSHGSLSYLQYEPPGWGEEVRPLVLFLHGAGERGSDPDKVAAHGIPREIERGKNFPFVAISPQCPKASSWVDLTQGLIELLDELVPKLHIDERRIYLTGLSMGAFGAWKLAATVPERFAALVPVCGGGDVDWAPRLRNLPTWAFHGDQDDVVEVSHSQTIVNALEQLGAPVKLTIYPGVGHDSWTQTYENPELFEWLLGQRRTHASSDERAAVTPEHVTPES
jgi:predicted peptidase